MCNVFHTKLLDSDWLKTSATFMLHGCKVRNTGSKLCNTDANYKWALIGSKNNRNSTRANQVRAVDENGGRCRKGLERAKTYFNSSKV